MEGNVAEYVNIEFSSGIGPTFLSFKTRNSFV